LSLSSPGHDREIGGDAPAKTIGLWNGVSLVIGLQIGSGIFSSPGVVLANASSVGASLVVWIVGGLLAWTGASSFAELGTMIPLNGGAQAYLAYAYSPLVAYLYTWTAVIVLKPGSNAIILLIFGEYLNRQEGLPSSEQPSNTIPLGSCFTRQTQMLPRTRYPHGPSSSPPSWPC
ncbi:hypothetical protein RSAG8_02283, partial [Rhizoctonia solani AG-8 WAC10335]